MCQLLGLRRKGRREVNLAVTDEALLEAETPVLASGTAADAVE